jgi:hypothetical protein
MYITSLTVTVSPEQAKESITNVPLTILQSWSELGLPEIRTFATRFASEHNLEVNWDTWEHSESTRTGTVDFSDLGDRDAETLARARWNYDPLDDPDNSEPLDLPIDHMNYVTGVLTPAQFTSFWDCVDPELQPLTHLDHILRRLGMTPADHDELDHEVMSKVIAMQWWRAYPTIATGLNALECQPHLTVAVLDQLNTMAINCYLDGENYDLFTTFVA